VEGKEAFWGPFRNYLSHFASFGRFVTELFIILCCIMRYMYIKSCS